LVAKLGMGRDVTLAKEAAMVVAAKMAVEAVAAVVAEEVNSPKAQILQLADRVPLDAPVVICSCGVIGRRTRASSPQSPGNNRNPRVATAVSPVRHHD
jgi:hypothetical protein